MSEQEQLVTKINRMPPHSLPEIIRIIREATSSTTNTMYDDEIDLEIDRLDIATQRKLLNYVNKE